MDRIEDMDLDSMEKIKSRMDYLEKTNSWYFIALEGLASLWDMDKDVKLYRDPKFLFANARKHLQQFMKFRTLAFYLVEEPNNQFLLEDCYPESDRGFVEKEVLYQIEQGNFAWALRQSHPLVVPDQNSDSELILHRVATKSRVAGMFVGRFEGDVHKIPIEQLNLISIILSNTAYAIENGSLFKHVQNQNLNLEQTVKERTQTLENKARQLKSEIEERTKIEEDLKRSNQDLQDFASIASHDLQEPLRKVIMFGDRLNDQFSTEMNEKALGFLERMGNAASRMQILIDELLLYSRVGSKAEPFKKTSLETIVSEVLSDLESRITRSGATIHMEALPIIEADGIQMRQLFQNLIGNALKFHKKDTPPEIMIRGRVNGSDTCEILVKDHGVGFDGKYIQRIFKPFERLHGRSDYEGTGMGLAICQKIVKRHGGSIHVESKINEGCQFTITLPIKQPEMARKEVG
jgi:signal transduction histidine kinase